MSQTDIQQILLSDFRTGYDADRLGEELRKNLGLSTQYNIARLALGRSLSQGPIGDAAVDAKGRSLKGSLLFGDQDVGLWLGLMLSHARKFGDPEIKSLAELQLCVRRHWSRGIHLLAEDWKEADEDYDKFVDILVIRRAGLPDLPESHVDSRDEIPAVPKQPDDQTVLVQRALRDIGVTAEVRGVTHGPRISRYKVYLNDVNQLDKLRKGTDKLALTLNVQKAGVLLAKGDEAKTVGLDIPRPRDTWKIIPGSSLRDWVNNSEPGTGALPVWPGVTALGDPYVFDLASAPHLLVGGTTGSGKSVCLHALILSLLWKLSPDNLQLALIDPKSVEFSHYKDIPHLYRGSVATTIDESRELLAELIAEMEARYQVLKNLNVQHIADARRGGHQFPHIVLVIEEFADLLMQADDVEDLVIRLAQKARASGIHLIVATQRPDAKTFSGLIRSNIPARIALTVQKSTESKIILDETGAETLLGVGDMLIKPIPGANPDRIHGLFVKTEDISECLRAARSNSRREKER